MKRINNMNVVKKTVSKQFPLTSTLMRDAFLGWLCTTGNAKQYSPEAILSCLDTISEYALQKKICSVSLWEYGKFNIFKSVYNKLLETKLLRVNSRHTYQVFIVAGQLYLKFLKRQPVSHNEDPSYFAVEGNKADSFAVDEISLQNAIDLEAVIAWLLTQPDADGTLYLEENVVRQYMSVLSSAPSKLLSMTLKNRNVFACRTAIELKIIWEAFKTAPNYNEINASTSGAFSVGMRCLLRYLEYYSNDRENQVSVSAKTEIDPKVIEKTSQVLSLHFANGFRIDSPIELGRFRSFTVKDLSEEITLSDEELRRYISACGTTCDGKVYAVSNETKEQIKEIAEDYFTDGAQAIFFSEFYSKNENWLFRSSIVSEDMLVGILRRLFPKLLFTQTYFGYTDASVFAAIESELLRVWGDDVLLTYEQLAKRLQYISLDRIKNALNQNRNFIWSRVGTFSHISRIDISESEREAIREVAVRECHARGYASIIGFPFNEIRDRNCELSITAIHDAVYRICLSDKFDKKGKIVTRKGDAIDAPTIMKEYCRTIDKCSLHDLFSFEKELTDKINRRIPMEAGNAVLVRIDKDTYVADKYVSFNVDVIDEAIDLFVMGEYLPLKSFTTFGVFPDCGQKWNLFLLESYCRRFSRKFRFDTPSVNSRNAGAVIRKSCGLDYTEIMADAVSKANIAQKGSAIDKFLYENGYTGRRSPGKTGEIIDKAKAIREGRN